MTLKIRSRPPKANRVIALPQGLIYVGLIILGLILFLESCPQAKISKTMTPGDLENKVVTLKDVRL